MKINILLICIDRLSLSKEIIFVTLTFNAYLEEPFQSTAGPKSIFKGDLIQNFQPALHICKDRRGLSLFCSLCIACLPPNDFFSTSFDQHFSTFDSAVAAVAQMPTPVPHLSSHTPPLGCSVHFERLLIALIIISSHTLPPCCSAHFDCSCSQKAITASTQIKGHRNPVQFTT